MFSLRNSYAGTLIPNAKVPEGRASGRYLSHEGGILTSVFIKVDIK